MKIARQEAPEYSSKDIPFSDVKSSDYFADAVMMGYTTETEDGDSIVGGYSDGTYKPATTSEDMNQHQSFIEHI